MMMLTSTLELSDGARVFLRRWLHPADGGRLLLCLHGSESHSEWFSPLAPKLVDQGLSVAAFDRSGWGRSEGKRGHLPHPRFALNQLTQVVKQLRQTHPHLHLLGMSWGGLLACYAGLRCPDLFSSITLLAPGLTRKVKLKPIDRWRVALGWLLHRSLQVELPMEPEDFTRQPHGLKYIDKDPLRVRQVSAQFCVSTLVMSRQVKRHLDHARMPPTLALLAQEDRIVDNPTLCAMLTGAGIKFVQLPDTCHALVFENPSAVADHVLAWIQACP